MVDGSPQLRVGGGLRRGGEGSFEISGKVSFPQNGQGGVLDFLQFGDDRVGGSQLAGGRGPGEAIILPQPVVAGFGRLGWRNFRGQDEKSADRSVAKKHDFTSCFQGTPAACFRMMVGSTGLPAPRRF